MKFGKYLKSLREAKDLTIKQFAEKCGVSAVYINDLESNKTDVFAEGLFYRMAKILNVNGDEFIIKSDRIPTWAHKYILKNWKQLSSSFK